MPCQVRRNGPVALVQGPDGYVSSWLAAPAALARVAADIGDTVVAVAATRDPPRWRHHGWPDDNTLTLLRASAVPDHSL
jgi:hypothetical protein